MNDFRHGLSVPVLSNVTAAEVLPASTVVRRLHAEVLSYPAEVVEVDEEALSLTASYEARSVLSAKFRNDMLHIALAAIANIDAMVSWNFKHIVRLDKIRLFSAVNLEQGYKPVLICSPREVIIYGQEE